MRVSNKMPSKSFEETGFYVSSFPNWRYTGRYGLVKNNIPLEELPKPYGGEIRALDEIMFHILALGFVA